MGRGREPGREGGKEGEADRQRQRARKKRERGKRRRRQKRERERETRVSAIIDVDIDSIGLTTNLEKLYSQPPGNHDRSCPTVDLAPVDVTERAEVHRLVNNFNALTIAVKRVEYQHHRHHFCLDGVSTGDGEGKVFRATEVCHKFSKVSTLVYVPYEVISDRIFQKYWPGLRMGEREMRVRPSSMASYGSTGSPSTRHPRTSPGSHMIASSFLRRSRASPGRSGSKIVSPMREKLFSGKAASEGAGRHTYKRKSNMINKK
jgi:hypothetical protein